MHTIRGVTADYKGACSIKSEARRNVMARE